VSQGANGLAAVQPEFFCAQAFHLSSCSYWSGNTEAPLPGASLQPPVPPPVELALPPAAFPPAPALAPGSEVIDASVEPGPVPPPAQFPITLTPPLTPARALQRKLPPAAADALPLPLGSASALAASARRLVADDASASKSMGSSGKYLFVPLASRTIAGALQRLVVQLHALHSHLHSCAMHALRLDLASLQATPLARRW